MDVTIDYVVTSRTENADGAGGVLRLVQLAATAPDGTPNHQAGFTLTVTDPDLYAQLEPNSPVTMRLTTGPVPAAPAPLQ